MRRTANLADDIDDYLVATHGQPGKPLHQIRTDVVVLETVHCRLRPQGPTLRGGAACLQGRTGIRCCRHQGHIRRAIGNGRRIGCHILVKRR